jgi:hypothetical protein
VLYVRVGASSQVKRIPLVGVVLSCVVVDEMTLLIAKGQPSLEVWRRETAADDFAVVHVIANRSFVSIAVIPGEKKHVVAVERTVISQHEQRWHVALGVWTPTNHSIVEFKTGNYAGRLSSNPYPSNAEVHILDGSTILVREMWNAAGRHDCLTVFKLLVTQELVRLERGSTTTLKSSYSAIVPMTPFRFILVKDSHFLACEALPFLTVYESEGTETRRRLNPLSSIAVLSGLRVAVSYSVTGAAEANYVDIYKLASARMELVGSVRIRSNLLSGLYQLSDNQIAAVYSDKMYILNV